MRQVALVDGQRPADKPVGCARLRNTVVENVEQQRHRLSAECNGNVVGDGTADVGDAVVDDTAVDPDRRSRYPQGRSPAPWSGASLS